MERSATAAGRHLLGVFICSILLCGVRHRDLRFQQHWRSAVGRVNTASASRLLNPLSKTGQDVLPLMQVKAEVAPIAEYAGWFKHGCGKEPMTTLAMLPPPLERLFDRIDAAEPTDAYLRALLDTWRAQRLHRFLPTRAALAGTAPEPVGGHAFSFVHAGPPTGDWTLVEAGSAARSILGPIGGDQRLADMKSRRLAVHLRRLFDFVRETAEPVAASFSERGTHNHDNRVEVVVAPLASDGRRVDGVFGGIVARQTTAAGHGRKLNR